MTETKLELEVGGRTIEIGNPDKVLFPDAGITKRDLAEYYRDVASVLLPHAEGRPISMHRFPDGLDAEGFYQKDVPDYFPDRIRHPDRMVFDFDPPGDDWEATFDEVRWAARTTADLLREIGLVPFVQTSGSKGLHIHLPLDGEADFDTVRELARDAADLLATRHPDRLTIEQRKKKRGERVYLDVARNAYAQTAVVPYAVRPRPGAPVATPLDWDELGSGDLHPRRYTIANILRRLGQKDDPWTGIGRHARGIDGPRSRLDAIL